MRRSSTLIIAGIVLLIAAAVVPLGVLAGAEWDTRYVYSVESGDSYCATVVQEPPDAGEDDDFRRNHENLSATAQTHVERAIVDGRHVVETEADAATDFQFTDDHVARGVGCYAIEYNNETHALRTTRESERNIPGPRYTLLLLGGSLAVTGAGSLLGGLGLAVKQRRA